MRVGVGLVVKNEQHGVAEWLAYHSVLGFDRFYVFDNASTDDTAGVIERCARRLSISLTRYPATGPDYQVAAMAEMVRQSRDEVDWLLVIDSDEFFTPTQHDSVQAFLRLAAFERAPAIALQVAFYGSNGHETAPDDLVISAYTRRAPDEWGPNAHIKSLIRPERAGPPLNPHMFQIDGAYVSAAGEPVAWLSHGITQHPTVLGPTRINHYFVKARRLWEAKLRRGYHDFSRPDEFVEYDRNEVLDESAARFAPAVKDRLESMGLR